MSQARAAEVGAGPGRRARLRAARLYLVTDDHTPAAELPALIAAAVAGGVEVVQLRRKLDPPSELVELARSCRQAAQAGGALFLVNDHLELAAAADADGVHLGQDDLDPEAARVRLGAELLIGLSTHDSEQLRRSRHQPVDYISAGPVRATPSKPGREPVGLEYVSRAARSASVPVVAIGGLGPGSAAAAIAAGADLIGVVRAICRAADPGAAAATLASEIDGASSWIWLEVNGALRKCPAKGTVAALLEGLEVDPSSVVVERNGNIVKGLALAQLRLESGDQLEVVRFVGGGRGYGG